MMIIPEIGDLVDYGMDGFNRGPGKYRVSGYLCLKPRSWVSEIGDEREQISLDIVREILIAQGKNPDEPVLWWSSKEDAQLVTLTGVSGAVAKIEDVIITGRVNWSQEFIERDIENSKRMIGRRAH